MRIGHDLDSVINDAPIHSDAIRALVELNRQLKRQGVDLIFMPVPNQVMVYAHHLRKDIPARANVWPAYTRGLIALLKADVEVLDLSEAFAAYDGEDLVLQPGDHHWASTGMDIASEQLAQRLDRYPHLAAYRSRQKDFVESRNRQPVKTSLLAYNRIWNRRKKKGIRDTFEEVIELTGLPQDELVVTIKYKGSSPTPHYQRGTGLSAGGDISPDLFIIGDSMVLHRVKSPIRGAGFPNHLGRRLGLPVSFYGERGGAARLPSLYSERFASLKSRPKVVVMVCRAAPLAHSAGRGKWNAVASPDAAVAKNPLGEVQGMMTLRLDQISKLPDPDRAVYADALVAAEATIASGPHKGNKIKIVHWAMKERKLNTRARKWHVGDTVTLRLVPWDLALDQYQELGTIRMLDVIYDLTLPQFWAEGG